MVSDIIVIAIIALLSIAVIVSLVHRFSGDFNSVDEKPLMDIVQKAVNQISCDFKKLDNEGRIEALLYCTSYLMDLQKDYSLDINKYLLQLEGKIKDLDKDNKIDDRHSFIRKRLDFYNDQRIKLEESSSYTPMFIYNAFYDKPLSEHPERLKDIFVMPIDLISFQVTLKKINSYIVDRLNGRMT